MRTNRRKLRIRRRKRIISRMRGVANRPRLCVFRSLKSIYVQAIDDSLGRTLLSASLKEIKNSKNDIENAKKMGKLVAQKCKEAKIKEIVFDRGGYKYHGKVKALADAIREEGIKF